jgi:indolepyruvate ferredoxin oxidoreductase beta subunit
MAGAETQPTTLMIAAMGGEGGGVLTAWVVEAARKAGLPVQATSIPGVAQRTGATTYYIEVVPTKWDDLGGKEPVLDLYPGPGSIDVMVATELLETGRAMERGFISPDRTTLIASTHRVYTLTEKMAMGDQRYDGSRVMEAAKQMARDTILFNMEKAALDVGSIINSVVLGAIAGSGRLPIPVELFRAEIEATGRAVKANLAGFDAGLAYAKGDIVEVRPDQAERPAPSRKPEKTVGEFKARIERDYPSEVHPMVMEACGRVLDYQDAKYARLYLDRLDGIRKIDDGRGDGDYKLTNEAARHLGLRMAFEDIMRVAQLKSRKSRFERVRREVEAADDQLVKVTEHFKPGPYEVASVLPKGLGRRLVRWADNNPEKARKWHFGLHIRTDTVFGYYRVRMLAGMRRMRRMGYRYHEEQELIDGWLDLIKQAARVSRGMALEVCECARLVKGYSDTHKRGTGNFKRIADELIRPAIASGTDIADEIARAREAALADPEGNALTDALAANAGGQPVPANAAE